MEDMIELMAATIFYQYDYTFNDPPTADWASSVNQERYRHIARDVVAALAKAGFVIVPRESHANAPAQAISGARTA